MGGNHELDRLEQRLVQAGWLERTEFDEVKENLRRYQEARVKNPLWPKLSAVAFVEVKRPRLTFLAWAAVRDLPLDKAEEVCAQAQASFGREFFEFKELDAPVPSGLFLGETLIKMGRLTEGELDRVLKLQKAIEEQAGVRLLLGILLVRHNLIDLGSYFQALSLHFGIDADKVDDELLEQIERSWLQKTGGGSNAE